MSGSGVEKCSSREWLTGSCVPTLLGNSQGSLMSVGIVPGDRNSSAKVWMRYHVTQFQVGSPSQGSEVSGSGDEKC